MSLIKIQQEIARLSQDLVYAQQEGNEDEVERLEEELEELREAIDAEQMDDYDSKHGGHGWR